MQRIWRSKPTQELIKFMEESVDLRLYLIAEKGPLSFTFQDEKGKKFMINIGDKINCNCAGNKKELKEHCVHTIYVLNRIFKISFSDQLILQLQFTDSELNKMIDTRRKNKNKIDFNNEQNSDSENESNINRRTKKKKKRNSNNILIDTEEKRMNLIDDITCSICQEDMYFSEGLFYCEESCGHNYHLDCLKVWSTHKKANEESDIKCPMCRQKWNDDKLKKQIVKNMAIKKNIKTHKGISCKNCDRKNIKGERFHCLLCDDYNLCIECFNLGIHKDFHSKENKFNSNKNDEINNFLSQNIVENSLIIKKSPEEAWHGLDRLLQEDEEKSKYDLKQIKFSQYLISLLKDFDGKFDIIFKKDNTENVNQNNNSVQENNNNINYQENEILEENKDNLDELSVSEHSKIDKENTNQNQNLQISNEPNENEKSKKCLKDLNCSVCNKPFRSSTLHLLKYKQTPHCGHIIHIKCVELIFKISIDKSSNFRVEESFNICKLDNLFIFPGLKNLKFNIFKNTEENNNINNLIQPNNKNNHNEFYIGNNSTGHNQNFTNNNFPSSNQKNKIYSSRNLSNRNNLLNKIVKGQDLFENALQVNNFGVKMAPFSSGGKSMSGKLLAPINFTHQNLNINNFNLNNLGKIQQNNKKGSLNNNNDIRNQVIGLAINIQKMNFDEENKIQTYEKSAKERIIENHSKKLSGKYHSSRRIINSLNNKADKSVEKNLMGILNIKNGKDFILPEMKIVNSKYNNADLPEVDPEFLRNEIQLNEDIINTKIINNPIPSRGMGIRTINHNNIGLKVK